MSPDTYAIMTVIWAATFVIGLGLANIPIMVGSGVGTITSSLIWWTEMRTEETA